MLPILIIRLKQENLQLQKKQTPAKKKGPSKKQEKERFIVDDVVDWWEGKIKIDPIVLPNPIDVINSVLKIFQPDENTKEGLSCGEKILYQKR
jgi:hypothetical protein